jgi:hypothetical protein
MAARHFTLAVTAVAKRLSDVYGDGAGVINAVHDVPYRQILLQAEESQGAVVYLGQSTVTTAAYGVIVPTAAAAPPVVTLGPFEMGPLKLSDLYAVSGGSANLHILAIPF